MNISLHLGGNHFMAKIIALFNNKGGVSKTTTTFHLGWKLAELGYKTLMIDTDPQCNLTGLCLNADKENKLTQFYEANNYNIKSALSPVLNNEMRPLEATTCYEFEHNENLFLLPGHIEFSEYDATYNIAENMTGSLVVLQNVPGALRQLITMTKYLSEHITDLGFKKTKQSILPYIELTKSLGILENTDNPLKPYNIIKSKEEIAQLAKDYLPNLSPETTAKQLSDDYLHGISDDRRNAGNGI